MKTHVLYVLVALLCCWAVDAKSSTITENEALQIVKNTRIVEGLSNTDVNFYIAEVDTIVNNYRCPVDLSAITDLWLRENTPKWLVFVDEEPSKAWIHSCRYYYINKTTESIKYFNGFLPPQDVDFSPIEIHRRFSVNPIASLPENPNLPLSVQDIRPNNFHAILYADSESPSSSARYLNDMQLLYLCLMRYNIPKENIHIVFTQNMSMDDGSYASQPKDFDGDGIDDYDENTTLSDVLDEISRKPYMDHLFIFSGTKGYPLATPIEDFDETVFNDTKLTRLGAAFTTVMFCRDGASLAAVESDGKNRIAICSSDYGSTQNDENEYENDNDDINTYSTDPLVKGFVGAMIGVDLATNQMINADSNHDGIITMLEATNYAKDNCYHVTEDCQIDDYCKIYSTPDSIKDIVSFTRIPEFTDLYIRDAVDESCDLSIKWNSPDIWIRNQDDGLVNQYGECITVGNSACTKYVYARVHNRGGMDYQGRDQKVYFSWADQMILSDPIQYNFEGHDWDNVVIENPIASGSSTIVKWPILLSDGYVQSVNANGGIASIGVTALVTDNSDYWDGLDPVGTVDEYNDLAFMKFTLINPLLSKNSSGAPFASRQYKESVFPIEFSCDASSIEIIPEIAESSYRSSNILSLYLELPESTYDEWEQNGSQYSGFSNVSNRLFKFMLDTCRLAGLENEVRGNISLVCRVVPALTPANDIDAVFHVVARNADGEIIDGSSYKVHVPGLGGYENGGLEPGIVVGINASQLELTAQNIGDNTDLAWLDSNFDNVGETNKYLVPEEDSNSSFSLVANSTETGQYGCAHIDLSLINVIKSIRKSQGALTCELLKPATGNTALYVTSVSTGETHSYEIPVGQNSIDVNLLNEGAIIATLRVNGKTMNSLQIIK